MLGVGRELARLLSFDLVRLDGILHGLGFQLATFPLMVGAFVGGQLIGGAIRRLSTR